MGMTQEHFTTRTTQFRATDCLNCLGLTFWNCWPNELSAKWFKFLLGVIDWSKKSGCKCGKGTMKFVIVKTGSI